MFGRFGVLVMLVPDNVVVYVRLFNGGDMEE